ncbi:hypothetical protein ACHAW5_004827 [Stephanodiscus triporus]|uniref:SAP domain-containing protein n=1 Tax=Stephanodiscus triporus TaxID=2934178 RepID=A0ABD3MTZ6_9STRA
MIARGKGQPDRVIQDILVTLNQEKQKHDIDGLYEGRLRSHTENFEGLKRKWQGFTGMPVPKKLRTSESADNAPVKNESDISKNVSSAKDEVVMAVVEEEQHQMPRNMIKTAVKMARADQAPATDPPAPMPPHPDDNVDIDSMTVNDLRRELRKRQLGTAGRKAELQARMRTHLAKEMKLREESWASKYTVAVEEVTSTQVNHFNISDDSGKSGVHSKDVNEMDVVMEDATESAVANMENDLGLVVTEPSVKKTDMSSSKASDHPGEIMATAKEVAQPTNCYPSTALKKQAPKSALKASKYNPSSIKSTPQLDDVKPTSEPMRSSLANEHPPTATIPTKISDSSTASTNNSIVIPDPTFKGTQLQSSVSKAKASSTLAYKTPGGSALKTAKLGGSGSAMLLEKKKAHSAASEARKARLAEMRQKMVQPNGASTSSATEPPFHSKYAVSSTLKKMASSSTLGESMPNSTLIKMREKAAAEKNIENALTAPPTKPRGIVEHNTSTTSSSTNTANRVPQTQTLSQPSTAQWPTALKSILDPANKPIVSEPRKPSPKKREEKPLSPMQTYEMSDREEDSDSGSESDEDENQRPKKSVPDWAQKVNLIRALEKQFADGLNRLDPDKIFGEVLTCNLEDIFDKKKSRYKKRTSSGNWTRDHVTLSEKLTYKRTMGYDQK